MQIYRGYTIESDGMGNYVIKLDEVISTVVQTEDSAYSWIDRTKEAQHLRTQPELYP